MILVLMVVLTVAIAVHQSPTLDIRVGQRATRDYFARCDFEEEDLEATRRARDNAELVEPRVFRNDPAPLIAVGNEAVRFLRRLFESDPRAIMEEAEDRWQLSPGAIAALKQHLDQPLLNELEQRIMAVYREAGRHGVLAKELRRDEISHMRYQIRVYSSPEQEPELRSTFDTWSWPDGLREEIQRHLEPILALKPYPFREALLNLLLKRTSATLVLDTARTEAAKAAARRRTPPEMKKIRKGTVILREGEIATEQTIRELIGENKAYMAASRPPLEERFRELAGTSFSVIILYLLVGLYIAKFRPDIMRSNTRLFMVGVISLLILGSVRLLPQTNLFLLCNPLTFLGAILAIGYGCTFALGIMMAVGLLLGFTLREHVVPMLIPLIGSAVSILRSGSVRRRTDLIVVGLLAGLAQFGATWALMLVGEKALASESLAAKELLFPFANGVLSGFALTGALPFIERLFGCVTDISLLEWSDQNQPLLRKLVMEAPGTYHHSMIVGSLAEAAAAEIGANALLARVSGFLHDVGKLNKPEYFIENTENQPSRHEKLSPMMSTLIITAHTKDGVELAKEYKLPAPIRDIIEQHHGTTTMEFFYNRALSHSGDEGKPQKNMFRYRGPKPQTPEAGIVMLADAVESASRTLDDPSPSRIESLVRTIITNRLMDAQLEETPLTFRDLQKIEKSLIRNLISMFHRRIRYPKSPTDQLESSATQGE